MVRKMQIARYTCATGGQNEKAAPDVNPLGERSGWMMTKRLLRTTLGVGPFSGLGKERIRLLGQSPSPEKRHTLAGDSEKRLREPMGIV
jgi:hypothetical protein